MLSIQIIKGELCEKYRVATLRIHIPAERSCSLILSFSVLQCKPFTSSEFDVNALYTNYQYIYCDACKQIKLPIIHVNCDPINLTFLGLVFGTI